MKRKVRKDFNPEKEYSVDVKGCDEAVKKEVQQGFFDVGILWSRDVAEYQYLGAWKYTNTLEDGEIAANLMFGYSTKGCNMTVEEFLELVYEPQQGHIYAELMAQYAEDAKAYAEPWKLWELGCTVDDMEVWFDLDCNPPWDYELKFRRKLKTRIVHGAEIPDISITPEYLQSYWYPAPSTDGFCHQTRYAPMSSGDIHRAKHRLCYPYTEEGKQAAILHAKAMLGVADA